MWQELGIEPTTELASIKRAYAARLKLTRPDQDAAGFARLRAAYEAALARVAGQQQAPAPRTEPVQPSPNMTGPSPADRPVPAPPTSPQPRDRLEEAVLIALQSRDVPAAADALERALKAGTLSIGTEMRLSGFMLQLLNRRPEIPLSQLIEAASRFGWSGGVPSTDPAVHVLRSRIAAESWFAELSESARAPSRILGAPRAGAAALLLGKGKFLFSRMFPPQPPLLSLMSELYVHAPWIRGRFDAERIAQVEALVGSLTVTAAKGRSYISNKRSPFFSLRRLSRSLVVLPPAILAERVTDSSAGFILVCYGFIWAFAKRPQWLRPSAVIVASGCMVALMIFALHLLLGDGGYAANWRKIHN